MPFRTIITIIHLFNEFLRVQSCTNKGDPVSGCCIAQTSVFGDSVTGAQKKSFLAVLASALSKILQSFLNSSGSSSTYWDPCLRSTCQTAKGKRELP